MPHRNLLPHRAGCFDNGKELLLQRLSELVTRWTWAQIHNVSFSRIWVSAVGLATEPSRIGMANGLTAKSLPGVSGSAVVVFNYSDTTDLIITGAEQKVMEGFATAFIGVIWQ
jgi:hypothetical protein